MNHQDISRLFKMIDNPITTIDSHTEGESTRIKGRAWVTGLHQFVLDKTYPFQQGYMA